MDLVTSSLQYINKNYGDVQVLQIGAMDGFLFDDLRGHLQNFKWNEVLVEPIPEIFETLVINLQNRDNCVFENSAITSENGPVKMLTVPASVIQEHKLHPGYRGMSALFPLKNGFGTSYERDIYVKDNLAEIIEVNGITLNELISKHNLSKIDVYISDAEGHDWMIFEQLDLNKFQPLFIRLEYINLTEDEKQLVKDKLEKHGYYFEAKFDITAVKKEIFENINKN